MATIAACGFECRVNNAAGHIVTDVASAAPVFDTTTVAPGGSGVSLKLVATAGSQEDVFFPAVSPANTANAVLRVRVLVSTLPTADTVLLGIRSATKENLFIGFDNATGKWCIAHQGKWANRKLGPTLSANTWYWIDVKADYGASPSAAWSVDGVAQTGLASADFNSVSGTWDRVFFGQRNNVGFAGDPAFTAWSAFYDDAAYSQTLADHPLTHTGVRLYVPSADGAHNTGAAGNFTNAAGTNITNATTDAWTYLDETPPTTTDRVEQRLDTSGNLYVEARFNSTAETATPLYLDALGVWRAATAASAAGQAKLRDNLGTTDAAIVNTTIAVTTDTYWRAHFAARPAALGAWTTGALNDLRARVGFGTDVTPDIWFGGVLVEVAVRDPQTATPDLATLTLTAFAPTVTTAGGGQTATPGVAALTITAFAPTILTPVTATPAVATLTTATFAPSALTPITATPGVASLTTTRFAPTVAATAHQTATPGAASLTLAPFAPAVAVSDNKAVVPSAAALTLTALTPSVATPVTVTPGVASLSLTTFAPSVAATANVVVTPGTAALSLTTYAPAAGAPAQAIPATASLTLAAFAPAVAATANQLVTPDVASLTLTTLAPTVSAPRLATPGTLGLTLTAFAPTVSVTANVTATPGTAALTLTALAPDVLAGADVVAVTGVAALTLTPLVPVVTASDHRLVVTATALLAMTPYEPGVLITDNQTVTPETLSLGLTTYRPSALLSINQRGGPGRSGMSLLLGRMGAGTAPGRVGAGVAGGRDGDG